MANDVRFVVRQRSNRPDEIEFNIFQEPDSAPLDYCILTATMGNMALSKTLNCANGFTMGKGSPLALLVVRHRNWD